MATVADRLEAWLRRHIFVEQSGSQCSHFALHHIASAGKVGSEVCIQPMPEGPEAIQATALEILDAAESDSTGLGAPQSYVVFAHYGVGSKPTGRFVIRARPNQDEDNSEAQWTEAPNQTGLITQLMRHNEAIMRTSSLALGSTMGSLQSIVGKQAEAIDRLMSERFETIEVIEGMMSMKQDRELEMLKLADAGERKKLLVDKLGPLVAIIANKVAGKPLLPAADPQSMALREFFKGLKPEQLEKLQSVLSAEQLMVVLTLAGNYVGQAEVKTEGEKKD